MPREPLLNAMRRYLEAELYLDGCDTTAERLHDHVQQVPQYFVDVGERI